MRFLQFFRCKVKHTRKIKYSGESLDSFLNSSLNVEFVTLILKGVTKQMIDYDIVDSFKSLKDYSVRIDEYETLRQEINETEHSMYSVNCPTEMRRASYNSQNKLTVNK